MAAVVHPRSGPSWDGTGLRLAPPGAPPYALRRLAAAMVLVMVVMLGASAVRVVAVAVGAVAGTSPPALPAAPSPAPVPAPATRVVGPGDSYWSIAVSLHPGGDVRAVVDHLLEVNGDRPLQPGDRVVLPVP